MDPMGMMLMFVVQQFSRYILVLRFFFAEDFREDILLLMRFCGSEGQWVDLRESQKVTQKPRFLPQLYGLPGHVVSINKFRDKGFVYCNHYSIILHSLLLSPGTWGRMSARDFSENSGCVHSFRGTSPSAQGIHGGLTLPFDFLS